MYLVTPVLILAGLLGLVGATPVDAQCNNPPPCRTPATTPTPVILSDCSQLGSISFVRGRHYRVTASNCAITVIRITQQDVIFEGYPDNVILKPANDMTDAIEILADGVALQNITLSRNVGMDWRFQDGIRAAHHVHNLIWARRQAPIGATVLT